MLSVRGSKIVSEGKPIYLKGVALGGWLMMEGYMLGGENIPETIFKQKLFESVDKELAQEFVDRFRSSFITQEDAKKIKALGFNCVRIPFNYRLIEATPFKIDHNGMELLKNAVKMFGDLGIYVILDMHAVPGYQNPDWHSDSNGEVLFWDDRNCQERYLFLWEELSNAFKNEEMVAAYDIMNEPVVNDGNLVKKVFEEAIKTVRGNGDKHIIFLEGNHYAREFEKLIPLLGDNIAFSPHFYEPVQFVFNWDPSYVYPGLIEGENWDRDLIYKKIKHYTDFSVPIYIGEFGIASVTEAKGGLVWLKDFLGVIDELGCHFTYWTYKSVAPMNFPDGIFQLCSHAFGMEKVAAWLMKDKKKFYAAMDTSGFVLNEAVMNLLKPALLAK
ncbi:MAG: glycoside hydrolase family 5 protein [Candidatus Saganbacteria bacterium]|nr:glycoside hydrolase family 5 protein [Candidatus Saganbacteria bacterium]